MARYIVPAEMPKSCAHCQFSILKASHPFWSKENPNTKKYRCALADLSIEVDFHDYTTKADWCPLVDASDFVPKSEVEQANKELDNLAEELSDLIDEKDKLYDEVVQLRTSLDEYEETSGLKQVKAELVREIFEEIAKIADQLMNSPYYSIGDAIHDIAELKKKYPEGNP